LFFSVECARIVTARLGFYSPPFLVAARFHLGLFKERDFGNDQRRAAMMEILAVAGFLSAVAMLLRAVRLLMVEIRQWRKPTRPRRPVAKKEPPA
jgi:cytochrome b561